jgi:hypothetical protein
MRDKRDRIDFGIMSQPRQQTRPSVILLFIVLTASIVPTAQGQRLTVAEASAAAPASMLYTCPMHPDVTADKPGNCAKCGMSLVQIAAGLKPMDYVLEFEAAPPAAHAGEKVRFRFLVVHPTTGEPVKSFHIVHDMPFHLFVVSRNLQHYQHLHPAQQPDGSLMVETVLPEAGPYEIFCDFFPVGGAPQVVQRSLVTADPGGGDPYVRRSTLEPDQSLMKVVDGVRVELTLEPSQPIAGRPTLLKYYLVDDATGQPVTDLQPYLGAWGHAVALREDATGFFHAHSTRLIPSGADRSRLVGDSRVSFNGFFARPGRHRIWSQFQRKGSVATVAFTVDVARLERVAKWDGRGWSPLAGGPINGLDGPVRALAVSGRDVYLGGDFTTVEGIPANGIARWDGHKWSSLGGGVNGRVWTIAVTRGAIYVGGDFTAAGGRNAHGIARWDGRNWSALGGGVGGPRDAFGAPAVHALVVRGREVYAGGRFATAGGVRANGIAQWNGHRWVGLGDGFRTGIYDGVVRALALRGGELYAGGQFTTASGVSAYNIARWNGRRWLPLGSGIRGNLEVVLAIGVRGRDVYVGGVFTRAGGLKASNLAKWNAGKWSAFELQTYDGVRDIAVHGRGVYVGGASFILPSGVVTKGIVKWDGREWCALGGGVGSGAYTGPVMAIAPSGHDLYVGGDAFSLQGLPTTAGVTGQVGLPTHETGAEGFMRAAP